jgi:hypothetical protein
MPTTASYIPADPGAIPTAGSETRAFADVNTAQKFSAERNPPGNRQISIPSVLRLESGRRAIDAAIATSKMPTARVDELADGFRVVKLGISQNWFSPLNMTATFGLRVNFEDVSG